MYLHTRADFSRGYIISIYEAISSSIILSLPQLFLYNYKRSLGSSSSHPAANERHVLLLPGISVSNIYSSRKTGHIHSPDPYKDSLPALSEPRVSAARGYIRSSGS